MLPPGESSQQPPPPPPAERAVDLLGDLPTNVLDKILAGLPARDVVRTSVLSSSWRRRWESVPGLDIELDGYPGLELGSWWGSAGRFLERCAGPVGRVSIGGVPLSFIHRIDDWLRAVAAKSPRSLSVQLPFAMLTMLPPSIFHCDPAALAELELCCCAIPAQPAGAGFTGFHRLTKLDLDCVVFSDEHENAWAQLEAMISVAAPTLVELSLQKIICVGGPTSRWVIQAPNLRQLVLSLTISSAGLWELGPLPDLEVASIFLHDTAEERDYVQMFTAISNVRELHIGNFHMNTQAAAINIFRDLLWRFGNLKILRLDGSFNEYPTNQLLSLSPSLETVEIKRW